ncbi:MAG: UDP-N-acetylglucosamine 1-carboxyvinyltransferase [Treponema sp.]|nr:UDP-N-acetylglucosamine 1-carboxyvinyltransferase [Treponema sp.]
MKEYVIEGGYPIQGTVTASGNKNAALPCLTATLLTNEEVILHNIPKIQDTHVMIEILKSIGAKVEDLGDNTWKIKCDDIKSHTIPSEYTKKVRGSIVFVGPLLARLGRCEMMPPGGDVIGRRRLDTHFLALKQLGASIQVNGHFDFSANKLVGADIFMDEASVTATENAVMAAVLAEGSTIIQNAASEPHIQDLCNMLNKMGAKISGIGSNKITIEGVKKLHGCEYEIGPDYIEIGSYIGMAAATKGKITIKGVRPEEMRPLKYSFAKLGISWSLNGDELTVPNTQELKVNDDFGNAIPKIDDMPWPGFPADLTSIMTVVATQVDGTVLIFEKMFESRMFFVDKLISMGAKITLCDPHRAVVCGPCMLHGDHLVSPDIRAGMAMVIAAMCAHGESRISNVYQIERGYEDLVGQLQKLGAHIRIENNED